MGLDSVELVIDVEEAFDIRIPDGCAVQIRTVGDLYDAVVALNPGRQSPRDVCLSAATFRLIRRAVQTDLRISNARIRPRDLVDSKMPRDHRRAVWSQFQAALDLKLPSLARPSWLTALATFLTLCLGVGCGYRVHASAGGTCAVLAGIGVATIVGFGVERLTSPFAVHPRDSFASFRGLVSVVLAHNYAKLSHRFNNWNPADIWDALRIIIVDHFDVKPEAVTRQTRFVEDLGMG